MTEAIGIMEGAFFVGRGELMQWINDTYQLNVTRIEQLGSGAVYCQILDSIFPGKVNMARVNWHANTEWEFINNLKVLQQSFLKCRLNKHIEIERLSKAKYQDNLEFAQWMKRYFDINGGANKDYDPVARRGNAQVNFDFGNKPVVNHGQTPKPENNKAVTLNARRGDKEKEKSVNIFKGSSSPVRSDIKKKSNLLDHKDKILESPSGDDVKQLFKYLTEMKDMLQGNVKDEEQRLEDLEKIVEKGLDLKLFKDLRKKDQKTASLVVTRGNRSSETDIL